MGPHNPDGVTLSSGHASNIRRGRAKPTCLTPIGRLMRHVEVQSSGCWQWTGRLDDNGYAHLDWRHGFTTRLAHRIAYIIARGEVPGDLSLDHLCRNKACVNPDHLEPVTTAENTRRHFLALTTCHRGHPRTGLGKCERCRRENYELHKHERVVRRREQRRAARLAVAA